MHSHNYNTPLLLLSPWMAFESDRIYMRTSSRSRIMIISLVCFCLSSVPCYFIPSSLSDHGVQVSETLLVVFSGALSFPFCLPP